MTDFLERSQQYQKRFSDFLEQYCQHSPDYSERLSEAIRYTAFAGGKRIRPLLIYFTGEIFNTPIEQLDFPAAAVELIHCYSLIHDDLPSMDDDDLRRGKPTCHIAFDEATAILAGDALQALAFEILAQTPVDESMNLNAYQTMIAQFAYAVGASGMVGGQSLDMESEGQTITLEQLEQLHRLKTGALIEASVLLSASIAGANEQQMKLFKTFAQKIGLAFQVQDDILDVVGNTETLGKPQGADLAAKKNTYVALLGLEQAQRKLELLYQESMVALEQLEYDCKGLRDLAHWIVKRHH